jgi:hypothetical protein
MFGTRCTSERSAGPFSSLSSTDPLPVTGIDDPSASVIPLRLDGDMVENWDS